VLLLSKNRGPLPPHASDAVVVQQAGQAGGYEQVFQPRRGPFVALRRANPTPIEVRANRPQRVSDESPIGSLTKNCCFLRYKGSAILLISEAPQSACARQAILRSLDLLTANSFGAVLALVSRPRPKCSRNGAASGRTEIKLTRSNSLDPHVVSLANVDELLELPRRPVKPVSVPGNYALDTARGDVREQPAILWPRPPRISADVIVDVEIHDRPVVLADEFITVASLALNTETCTNLVRGNTTVNTNSHYGLIIDKTNPIVQLGRY
jgi:hypothetical protein